MPAVVVTGPRQSGKTTLCRAVFPNHAYVAPEKGDRLAHRAEAVGIAPLVAVARQPALLVGSEQPERVPPLGLPRVRHLTALESYGAHRDARVRELLDVTDRIASFDWGLEQAKTEHLVLSRAMNALVKHLGPAEQRGNGVGPTAELTEARVIPGS